MPDLREIAGDPRYDSEARGASKATIVLFLATFACMAVFSSASPGVIGGAAFFLVGIFAVSIVISMPLFLLRAKAPGFGPLITVADWVVTILCTRFAYLWLFAGSAPFEAPEPFVASCAEPLPDFTLRGDSRPTSDQEAMLCACIWSRLDPSQQEFAKTLQQQQGGGASEDAIRSFGAAFGNAVRECGGGDL